MSPAPEVWVSGERSADTVVRSPNLMIRPVATAKLGR
jgi:hypothetical protein